jgi:hypothetical protein
MCIYKTVSEGNTLNHKPDIEWVLVAVTLQIDIQEVLGSNHLQTPAIITEISCGFVQPLQAKARTVL